MVDVGHLADLVLNAGILREQRISNLLLLFLSVISYKLNLEDIGFVGDLLSNLCVAQIWCFENAV